MARGRKRCWTDLSTRAGSLRLVIPNPVPPRKGVRPSTCRRSVWIAVLTCDGYRRDVRPCVADDGPGTIRLAQGREPRGGEDSPWCGRSSRWVVPVVHEVMSCSSRRSSQGEQIRSRRHQTRGWLRRGPAGERCNADEGLLRLPRMHQCTIVISRPAHEACTTAILHTYVS